MASGDFAAAARASGDFVNEETEEETLADLSDKSNPVSVRELVDQENLRAPVAWAALPAICETMSPEFMPGCLSEASSRRALALAVAQVVSRYRGSTIYSVGS